MIIKEEWQKIQEGLYAEKHTFIVNGIVRTRYNIYSSDGYCFYSKNDNSEYPVYSEMAFTPCTSIEEINNTFVSIPIVNQKIMPKDDII